MTEHEELKPCPFCGGRQVSIVYVRDGKRASCNCGAAGKPCFHGPLDMPSATERAAIEWNRRAS